MKNNKVDEFIANPKRALFVLSLPVLVGMFVQTMFNIVDTAFIGRVGTDAIAALTFTFPLFVVLIALVSGLAMGTTSRVSRYLGSKNKLGAENAAMHGLYVSLIVAFILIIVVNPFLPYILSFLGASGQVGVLALSYFRIILFGICFMFPAMILNNIFSAQGDTVTPMIIQISSLVLNIILDPILIFGFNLGVKGAAIATVISMFFSLVLYVILIQVNSYLKIHPSSFNFSKSISKDIFFVGLPASFTMLLMSLNFMVINRIMVYFSFTHVALIGIVTRLESLGTMPIFSISAALITLTGMFYGAKRSDLLKKTIWYGIKIAISIGLFTAVLLVLFSELFFRIFTTDANLISLGVSFLRIEAWILPLVVIPMIVSRVMYGMGFGLPGLMIALTRIVFVGIPLSLIFVFVFNWGYLSIAFAFVISSIVANVVGFLLLRSKLKKVNSDINPVKI